MILARRLTALALLALLLVLPGVATSVEADGHGWWWRTQTGLLGAQLPPPPDIPENGLYVERSPDGATGISALRFVLADDEARPVLRLSVASEQGGAGAAIAVCPATTRWDAAQAGRWEFRPAFDCELARVDGARADDGSEWTFELSPLVRGGVIDVVLVDGTATPFRVAFDEPTSASLETQREASPPPPPRTDPEPVPPPAPDGGQDTSAPPPGRGEPVFVPPPVADVGTPPTTAPPPEVASPGEQPAPPPAQPPVAVPATTPAESGLTGIAWLLVAAIGALVLFDVLSGVRRRPSPRNLLRGAPATAGGIGRFARPRDERPAPLW